MTQIVQIAFNPVVAKIIDADRDVKSIVSDVLSYAVEGAEFMHAFASGTWDGRSSFFTHRTASFPAGFVHLVHSELTRRGYQVQIVKRPLPAPLGPEKPVVDGFGNDDARYDYQLRALAQVERHGRGIIRVATGGGKSRIAKFITARYARPTLFLTTRGVLMHQMADAYREMRLKVGLVGDGTWAPIRDGINCGMVQTLVARLAEPDLNQEIRDIVAATAMKEIEVARDEIVALAEERVAQKTRLREQTIEFLHGIEVVIGEEAHEAGGNSYYEILRHCRNAPVRVALTATPFMRAATEDNMRLMAAFGPILINISEKMLIERGILARPYFLFRECEPHPKLRKTSPWQRAYQLGYVENTAMTAAIVLDAVRAKARALPVMTLVQRTAHGDALREAMTAAGLRVEYIRGESDQLTRRRALNRLGKGEIDVLIGTTILDVGVDVPAVGLVQLAGGGKAEVALRQRIGRGLRAKKSGPNVCFIADYSTGVNSHLREHARQRRGIIEATEGFAEQILPSGADFPWDIFDAESEKAA